MVARIRVTQSCLVLLLISTLCFYKCTAEDQVASSDLADQPDSKQLPVDDPHASDDLDAPAELDPTDPKAPVDLAPDVVGEVKEADEVLSPGVIPGVEQPIAKVSCYQCNTAYEGEKCASSEPEDLTPFLKACPQNNPEFVRCRKAQHLVQGDKRVIRSCATLGSAAPGGEDICIDRTGSHKIATRTCDCFNKEPGQPCNQATRNTLTSPLSVILLLTSLVVAVRSYS